MVDKLITYAKQLRTQSTDTEQRLWQFLRAKRFYVWDNDICTNTEGVLQTILHAGQRPPSPESPPLKGGEKIKHASPFPAASHRSQ